MENEERGIENKGFFMACCGLSDFIARCFSEKNIIKNHPV